MPITLHPYRNDLPILYQKEKKRIIHSILQIKDIHHVGSSAVPGLGGKNIIDILIGVDEYENLEQLIKQFKKLGYITEWIDYKKEWAYLSNKPHDASQGDFHIHILRKGSEDYKNMLLFRDYLIAHKEERDKYTELKPIWLKKSRGVGMKYALLKTKYIRSVINENKST